MGNFLSGGGILDNQAFLGHAQKSAAVRYSHGGAALTCWMGRGFYLTYFLFGLVFGPGLTFWLIFPPVGRAPFLDAPLGAKILLLIFVPVGWLLLLGGILWRRQIVIDFAHGHVTFSSRFFKKWEQVIRLDDVRRFVSSSIVRRLDDENHSATPSRTNTVRCYLFGLETKDGRTIQLLETTRHDVVEQIAGIVQKETHGRVELLTGQAAAEPSSLIGNAVQNVPAAPDAAVGIARFAVWAFLIAWLGLMMVVISSVQIGHTLIVRQWPNAAGTVEISRMWLDSQPPRHEAFRQWRVYMQYQYDVDGKSYKGEAKYASYTQGGVAGRQYPVGSSVRVSYDPAKPLSNTLDTDFSPVIFSILVVGAGILFGYVMFIRRLQQSRRALQPVSAAI
jgi:hypothetical protein